MLLNDINKQILSTCFRVFLALPIISTEFANINFSFLVFLLNVVSKIITFLSTIVIIDLTNIFLGYYINFYSCYFCLGLIMFLILIIFLFLGFFLVFNQLKIENKILLVYWLYIELA